MADILDKERVLGGSSVFRIVVSPNKLNACIDDILIRLSKLEAANGQPTNQWTSVNDSLPSDNKPCIVMTEKNGLGVSRLMGRNRNEWTLFGEPVLYWLPMPEPPKESKR